MTTPKLYTATVSGRTECGVVYKAIQDGMCFAYLTDFGALYTEPIKNLPDLTEVTVVPKDAVVIEGVTAQNLSRLLKDMKNNVDTRLTDDEFSLLAKIEAQLTPPRPEEQEEPPYRSVVITPQGLDIPDLNHQSVPWAYQRTIDGEDGDLSWQMIATSDEWYSWKQICEGATVVFNPTRVEGKE